MGNSSIIIPSESKDAAAAAAEDKKIIKEERSELLIGKEWLIDLLFINNLIKSEGGRCCSNKKIIKNIKKGECSNNKKLIKNCFKYSSSSWKNTFIKRLLIVVTLAFALPGINMLVESSPTPSLNSLYDGDDNIIINKYEITTDYHKYSGDDDNRPSLTSDYDNFVIGQSFEELDETTEEEDKSITSVTSSSSSESTNSLESQELDKIRKSIMEDLGLSRIPDSSKANVSQTEYEKAHREYLKRAELSSGQDQRTRRRLHVFYPEDHVFDNTSDGGNLNENQDAYRHSIYFPVNIPTENHAIDHATLRILISGYHNDFNHDVKDQEEIEVLIYQPTRTSRRLVSRRKINVGPLAPRWAEFDSTETVSGWIHEGEDNFGFELEVKPDGSGVRLSSAALNVFTISDTRFGNRIRRATPDQLMSLHRGRRTECRGQNKKCCRHQMTVTFKDLKGFEFIIQPKVFDAGYCKGRCPPRYNPAHHHALLQSLIWKEDRKKAPRPCCAPSKLAELEILYFDENDATKLKVSNWKNMKVLECACS